MSNAVWKTLPAVPSSLDVPRQLLRVIAPGMTVLDVGCGEAGAAADIQAAGAEYVGLDCNWPSLARAAQKAREHASRTERLRGGGAIRVVLGEGERLPFRSACFDVVLLRAVLTVLPSLDACRQVLGEALRVSRIAVCTRDFLQTWDDPYYAARYRAGEAETGERGAFLVREGDAVLYRARHFTSAELFGLMRSVGGETFDVEVEPVRTRSGKTVQGICLLCRYRAWPIFSSTLRQPGLDARAKASSKRSRG